MLIPILIALGLLAGFAREVLLAYLYGASRDIEIFRIAFGLPSILSDSLALSFVAVLIPILLEGEKRRPAIALQKVLWASISIALIIFVTGIMTMPIQAQLLAPGIIGTERDSLILSGRICWTACLLVILSLPLRTLMITRGRIWPGASSQIMRSGGFAIAMIAIAFGIGSESTITPSIAAMFGGVTVLLTHILALGSRDRKRIRNVLKAPSSISKMSVSLAALSTVLLTQLLLSGGRLMDRAAASLMPEGTLAGLEYSYALLMAVAAVLGTSTNLVLAPRLGRALRDYGKLSRNHWILIAGTSILSGIVGIMLSIFAHFLVPLVYQYGAFDEQAAALTIKIFRIHALALGPLVLALQLTQVLLLQGRQKFVVWTSVLKIIVKIAILALVIHKKLGIEGIAVTLIVVELIMALLQGFLINRMAPNKFKY